MANRTRPGRSDVASRPADTGLQRLDRDRACCALRGESCLPTTRCVDDGRTAIVHLARMQTTEQLSHEQVLDDRARYVSGGVATPRLVVARADGARVTDVDGRVFVDFAGGHRLPEHRPPLPARRRGDPRAGRPLPPPVLHGRRLRAVRRLCRLLAELSPCEGGEQNSILVNSGAEAVENAVKIARAATGRPAVVVFDNAFHGRTLLTMAMTARSPVQGGFGPFAPEVYRAPVPYPYRGVTTTTPSRA